jgi:hypothetical protein
MEICSIGRDGLAAENCFTLEIFGKHLFYAIVVDPEKLVLMAQVLDCVDLPEVIVTLPDDIEGFKTLARLLRGFERNDVTSLNRPIEIGEAGSAESWVIA